MAQWKIDPSHSRIEFAVRHLGISTVHGRFRKFEGTVTADDDGTPRAIEVLIDAASVDTAEPQRDSLLRSADFLETVTYPHIAFRSQVIDRVGPHRYRVDGDATIRNETRPLSFELLTAQPLNDSWGTRRAAAAARGALNRKDFGLTYNRVLELGGVLVGGEVRFLIDLEVEAQAAAA